MDPAHVVLLLAVFIAVAAIAGYLIVITLILRHVVARLVTILAAVQAVTDTSQPVGPILEDISRELDAGRQVMEGSVQRLEESRAPVTAEPGRLEKMRSGSAGGDATTAVAAPPPSPGPAPPASTIPSPTHPSPPPGSPGAEDEDPGRQPPPERKRSWWTR